METRKPNTTSHIRRQKGGYYCIAPGQRVHFHKLTLKRRTVLLHWLAALKRKKPPMGAEARVCSEHFLAEDYIEEKTFETANLVIRRTNKLKTEAVPSVFNFSGYNTCSTDRPTQKHQSTMSLPVTSN
uniref:THAP domain-containing protein 1 n=1 Tax=Sinocyclocheilus anshuiensis TaxID=1608454 RepID=A0A671P6D0_9TELE